MIAQRRDRALAVCVHAQLPRILQDRLIVSIDGDAFGLRIRAKFHPVGPTAGTLPTIWSCELEPMEFHGVEVRAAIPEAFMSRLCIEVP